MAALPRTGSGKLDRRALPEVAAQVGGDAPEGDVERTIAAAFAQVLGLPEVGRDDDFFLIGGHSILAGQLARLLSERLGVRLGLADLFATPSVAAIAARVDDLPAESTVDDGGAGLLRPDPARWHQPFPLTDVQAAYYVGRGADLQLGGVSTHAYLELVVEELDLDRFTAALHAVIDRHPMLRAVIRPDGSQQVLAEVPPYRVEVYALRAVRRRRSCGIGWPRSGTRCPTSCSDRTPGRCSTCAPR